MIEPFSVDLTSTIKCQAINMSDFLGAFGGLMGLLSGISVFSIIELVFTILKCVRLACCKTKVHPIITVQPKSELQKFVLNQHHLFYLFGINFVEFLKKSSIHGAHYLRDKKLSWIEKTFWIVAISVSTVVCSILIADSLDSLHAKSVIITYDEHLWNKEDVSSSSAIWFVNTSLRYELIALLLFRSHSQL